jgi:predicted ribosomally synthesized peptide with SipW-like signal peptide
MNKRILISLSVIGVVAAIAVGGTIAYFSDTETSTGNTFTAGQLDLIVDINGTDQNPLTQTLFNLPDMKPGDSGEVTLSLGVDDNPSCGFVDIVVYDDFDNTCTEPEEDDEFDCASSPTGTEAGSGELNDTVIWMIWKDDGIGNGGIACNNIMDGEETALVSGPLTTSINAYGIDELPIYPSKVCYGVAYCFGTWTGTTCDGSQVNNASQSDSFKGDLTITAKQKRNQYDTGCPVGLPQ